MNQNKNITVLIVAGGTGGHIIPGIGIKNAFEQKSKKIPDNIQIEFLSAARNRDFGEFKNFTRPVHFYDPPRVSKNPISILIFFFKFFLAFINSLSLIRKVRPAVIVGMGGYTTLPVLFCAWIMGVPYYLCEQNAIPGKATRLFAKGAKSIFINIPFDPDFKTRFAANKLILTGNPIRSDLLKNHTNISPTKSASLEKQILVLGGSQGALQLNEMCKEVIWKFSDLKDQPSKLKWKIQCGAIHLESMKKALPQSKFPNVVLFGYLSRIGELMAESDVLICRSGAGVLSEAVFFGLPLILVPYPWSSDGHQEANANYYERNGAAKVIAVKTVRSDLLFNVLQEWLHNPEIMIDLANKSKMLANPNSGNTIVDCICKDLQEM